MTGTRLSIALPFALLLVACGDEATNPPTEPAPPVVTPEAAAPPPNAPPGAGAALPGAGPASFVGRWAADIAWCSNTTGAERPIEITTTRFEGYENSCSIDRIDEEAGGYDANLTCQAEGMTAQERVRLAVQGDSLRLTWPDRNGAVVLLTRCGAGLPPSEAG
jgi:hypothetical protein